MTSYIFFDKTPKLIWVFLKGLPRKMPWRPLQKITVSILGVQRKVRRLLGQPAPKSPEASPKRLAPIHNVRLLTEGEGAYSVELMDHKLSRDVHGQVCAGSYPDDVGYIRQNADGAITFLRYQDQSLRRASELDQLGRDGELLTGWVSSSRPEGFYTSQGAVP